MLVMDTDGKIFDERRAEERRIKNEKVDKERRIESRRKKNINSPEQKDRKTNELE